MIKYLWALPLALALIIMGCSDNDDYQVAEPLQAGNQQVHFSSVNKAKTILGSDAPPWYVLQPRELRRFPLPSRMLRPVSLQTSR